MSKVLIEFYSGRTNENLSSILNEHFDKVCFLYSSAKCAPTVEKKDALSRLVKDLFGFQAKFYEIKDLSLPAALAALHKLWCDTDEFLIDITGGDEAFIAAAGIFSAQRGAKVTLHQYDVYTGERIFRYPTAKSEEKPFPRFISAEELLSLNGAAPLEKPQSYVFTRGPLKQEILRLWNAVKNRPKEWNRFCSLDRDPSDENHAPTQKELEPGEGAASYQSISARLRNVGILSDEERICLGGRDYMKFSLNVPEEAMFLYDKAGTILEMYSALCAGESGLFHDIRVGVKLDWDGKIANEQTPDPYNEIDLVLMQGNLPILVSCKNTVPKNEQLYEITVMAKHYGGHYATPALFCSGNATEGVKKRADEMGVVLIDGIRYKTPEFMIHLLKKKFDIQSPLF